MALSASGPMPAATLDGNPPNPTGPAQPPSLQQLTPSASMGGSMQVVQLSLQAAAEAAKLIDLIGQVNPNFAPTAQMLIEQLKGGLRSTIQQGIQSPGASLSAAAPPQQGMLPPQASPPMQPSGFGGQ